MLTKLFDKLSGTHITLIILGAFLIPGTLYAVPAFQNVAIINANTGYRASVDTTGRLFTRDFSAGLPNNPGQQVDIFFNLFNNACATTYDVPPGKALVVTALTGENVKNDTSFGSAQIMLINGSNCSGSNVSIAASGDAYSTLSLSYGSGILIPAGGSLSLAPSNNVGFAFAHGYLIAASAIPAGADAPQPMAAQDSVAIRAKIARLQQRR